MPNLFSDWCNCEIEEDGLKELIRYTECDDGRDAALEELPHRIRDHYLSQEELADAIEDLGLANAAAAVRELLPTSVNIRSGDLGEILAVEACEEELDYRIPIRRLRYKDHRNMSMRGDDLIGVDIDDNHRLLLLKGESKSRQALAAVTIAEAREALESDHGRPSAHSLMFVARVLIREGDDEDQSMGKRLRQEAVQRAVPKERIGHLLFTLSGNPADQPIADDFDSADGSRPQYIVNVRIRDHGEFIEEMFERAEELGDD